MLCSLCPSWLPRRLSRFRLARAATGFALAFRSSSKKRTLMWGEGAGGDHLRSTPQGLDLATFSTATVKEAVADAKIKKEEGITEAGSGTARSLTVQVRC